MTIRPKLAVAVIAILPAVGFVLHFSRKVPQNKPTVAGRAPMPVNPYAPSAEAIQNLTTIATSQSLTSPPWNASQIPPLMASLQYVYKRSEHRAFERGMYEDILETRKASGDFLLQGESQSGFLALGGQGPGEYVTNIHRRSADLIDPAIIEDELIKGHIQIEIMRSGGTLPQNFLEISLHGQFLHGEDTLTNFHLNRKETKSWDNAGVGSTCRFEGLDLVHGGKYSVHADLEETFGTCELQLVPK